MNVVVIGAGPAGLAGACCAAESGSRVTLVDDNPAPGGQIWRGSPGTWMERLRQAGVQLRMASRVISATGQLLSLESANAASVLPFEKLIIATGSRERFLPFPGWTLPGVMGAGGLQALVKSGLPIQGKQVVVAGSGPLLLAVAAHLRKSGASIRAVAEQAPLRRLIPFGLTLPWAKRLEAFRLWCPIYKTDTWVQSASGDGKLQRVTLRTADRVQSLECDYLATGYGLIPNTELAQLLNCTATDVDEFQQTNRPGISCAGEVTGIGGVDLALCEGSIAGYAAAGRLEKARERFSDRARWRRFAKRMEDAFALRAELRQLARPETLVCRCEDVPLSQLRPFKGWREAKLQTRCGMGPCQGRICGPAAEFLLGWQPDSVRPPIFPSRVSSLLAEEKQ